MNKKLFIKNNVIGFLIFVLFFFVSSTGNSTTILSGTDSYISTEKSEGVFTLSESGKSSQLFVSSEDYPGVKLIAKLLQRPIFSRLLNL